MLRTHRAVCESIESRYLLNGGIRDMSFGANGIVTAPMLSNSGLNQMNLLSGGKLLVGGYPYVARLTPDGELDPTFGTNGLSRALVDSTRYGNMAAGPDGNYYLFTPRTADDGTFSVARYTADGQRDQTFGGGQGLLTALAPLHERVLKFTRVLSDGSLLLGGNSGGLLRISATGAISNFDSNVPGPVRDVIEMPDGDLFLAYNDLTTTSSRAAVVCLNTDGTVDTSFARFIAPIGADNLTIVRQSSGRIVLSCVKDLHTALYGIESSGQLDSSWGTNGMLLFNFGLVMDRVDETIVHGDDSLTLAVSASNAIGYLNDVSDVVLAHLNAEGDRDALFGANGLTRYSGGKADTAEAFVQQPDGKLVLYSNPSTTTASGQITSYSSPVTASPISITAEGCLQVVGTAESDVVSVSETATKYVVSINGVTAQASSSLISSALIAGSGGDDQITLNIQSDLPVTLNGGSGNDSLHVLYAASAGVHVVNPQAGEASLTFADGTRPISGISVEHIDRGGATPFLVSAALEMETRLALNLAFDADIGTTLSASDLVLRDVVTGAIRAIGDADLTLSLTPSGTTLASIALPTNLPSAHWRLDIAAGAFGIGGVNDFEHRVRFDYSPGDVNGNGLTDVADVFAIVQHFGQRVSRRSEGDVNYDGRVGFEDLLAVAQNFNLPAPLPMSVGSRSPKRNELADVVG